MYMGDALSVPFIVSCFSYKVSTVSLSSWRTCYTSWQKHAVLFPSWSSGSRRLSVGDPGDNLILIECLIHGGGCWNIRASSCWIWCTYCGWWAWGNMHILNITLWGLMSETIWCLLLFPKQYRLKPKFAEKEHTGCIKCAANNGAVLATGSSDETIRQVILL